MPMDKVRIKAVSQGLGKTANLVNAATGESLGFEGSIESIEWKQDTVGRLVVTFLEFEIEADGPLNNIKRPTPLNALGTPYGVTLPD